MIRIRGCGGLVAATLLGLAAPGASADGFSWASFASRPDDWYRGAEGRRVAAAVRSHQSARGSWPKNVDTSARPFEGDRAGIAGTFDNGATTGESRFLARAYRAAGDPADAEAVRRAVEHILGAQYPSGGWPQSHPPGPGYHRHITFNDDAMVRLLEFLRDVGRAGEFEFLGPGLRDRARAAFDAGIGCIVRCQVVVDGRPTAWCAQHDEVTLEPRKGRAFEPASLSGSEGAGILMLLMSLDRPGPEVVRAVEAGAAWFESARLIGIRVARVDGDARVVPDPGAPPLWARFYDIGTNRPLFSGRDGVVHHDLAAIDPERRNGYAWYGTWGRKVAERLPRWRAERGRSRDPAP